MTKSKIQSSKFIKAAKDADCYESEAAFDGNLKRIAKAKPKAKTVKKLKKSKV